MELSVDNLSKFVPYYYTRERTEGILAALRGVPEPRKYFAKLDDPEPLQGDGWSGLQVLNFFDGTRDRIKGVVLSNSCDLAVDNSRLIPSQLNFMPLIPFADYLSILARNGINAARIEQHAKDVRAQLINSLFFLPAGMGLQAEHIALMSDVHTIPLSAFNSDSNKARIFSLSDVGFYLFVFKLSVHFCRMHENIDRAQRAG